MAAPTSADSSHRAPPLRDRFFSHSAHDTTPPPRFAIPTPSPAPGIGVARNDRQEKIGFGIVVGAPADPDPGSRTPQAEVRGSRVVGNAPGARGDPARRSASGRGLRERGRRYH